MKFDSLYQQVFLSEQDEVSPEETQTPEEELTPKEGGVASPDSINVEPAPVSQSFGDSGGLSNYISKLQEFAKEMQNTESDCLQKLVSEIDRNGSLFMGISRELSSRIIKISSDAKEIATILEGFILNAPKRQRDISLGQK
jgi:hypothetical protein